MSKPQTELPQAISDGGIAAKHPVLQGQHALVGPATEKEHNTIKAGIIPIACWRVETFRFAFDSSMVAPELGMELNFLSQLLKDHPPASKSEGKPGFPLSVFGHADSTGDDEYNKQLSGRRAIAIYALLTRDTGLWEKLFSQPFGNDKWGTKSLEVMLDTVSPATAGKSNHEQALQHERDAGKRNKLFGQYMEKLCGPELKLEKRDFLGGGEDAGRKGDVQGCSEFNPVLIVSQEQQKKFELDKDKTARNEANKPNRRVMVLIFRKGSRVSPAKWPCPSVNDGTAGCRKRFWSDGEMRRSKRLADKPRNFEDAKDTFACRFYSRLVDGSPCERTRINFSFRLYDLERRFIGDAPFELVVGDRRPIKGTANAKGFAVVPDVEVPNEVVLRWGFAPEPGEAINLVFEGRMFLTPDDADRETEAAQKLQNLGYFIEHPLAENVAAFQHDYGHLASPPLQETGNLDDATLSFLRRVYASSEDHLLRDQPSLPGDA